MKFELAKSEQDLLAPSEFVWVSQGKPGQPVPYRRTFARAVWAIFFDTRFRRSEGRRSVTHSQKPGRISSRLTRPGYPAEMVTRAASRQRCRQQLAFPASTNASTMTLRTAVRGWLQDGKRGETRCRGRLATVRRHRDSQQGFDSASRQIPVGSDHDSRGARPAQACLAPDGWLFLSASGVSDAINPGYAKLYAKDFPDTCELHTYFSRSVDGRVLYATHHFTSDELASLLERQGFSSITVTTELEASSRRPDEAAYFLYGTCRNGGRAPCTDASIWCSSDGDQEATPALRRGRHTPA